MNNRERFCATMAFEKTDRPCHVEHGFWPETYARWQTEGLPAEIHGYTMDYIGARPDLFDYFDITHMAYVLRGQYFIPPFEESIVEETVNHRTVRDTYGRLMRYSKQGASLPQELDCPVKTMRDYEGLIERLKPCLEARYPDDWESRAAAMRDQDDVVICTHMDGFFAYPRELMGVTHLLTAFYTDPDLLHRMINDRVEFYMQVYERAIRDVRPDFAFIWEDMSYMNGPLISPAMFREFMLPAYKKLTVWLRELGVTNIVVDSDGDVRMLIPLWIEGGVTGCLPFEAKTPMDMLAVAREFPTLQIMGGINKHCLEDGCEKEKIEADLQRVLPEMIHRGGYCVSLDHWVQPQIPLTNYAYYVERVREWPCA